MHTPQDQVASRADAHLELFDATDRSLLHYGADGQNEAAGSVVARIDALDTECLGLQVRWVAGDQSSELRSPVRRMN